MFVASTSEVGDKMAPFVKIHMLLLLLLFPTTDAVADSLLSCHRTASVRRADE
jgi:hypothetical protein